MASKTRTPVTPKEYLGFKQRLNNWGRWGADDQRGTLNHITPEGRLHAISLVRDGVPISCSNPIATSAVVSNASRNGNPAEHRMRISERGSGDFLGISYHRFVNTHIDALCHMYPDGRLYNDKPVELVTDDGAQSHSIDQWRDGVVTRGVLYDIPRMRGTDYVDFDRPVEAWDLEEFAEAHGIQPRAGDAVLVRSGYTPFWEANPDFQFEMMNTPGVGSSVLEFLYERDAAILAWDLQEASGHGLPARVPLHEIAIPYMGLSFVDNANFEALAEACHAAGRYEFLFVVAPLVLLGGTGSPVNPLAIL